MQETVGIPRGPVFWNELPGLKRRRSGASSKQDPPNANEADVLCELQCLARSLFNKQYQLQGCPVAQTEGH